MTSRTILGAALALTLLAGTAQAAPLAGKGENIEPIATLEIDDSQKNELELAGDYAYVDHDDGMDIVDISDPAKPKVVGELKCKGSGGDIDISPDATIAVRATAHDTPCGQAGTAASIVDISDKTNPRIIGKIDVEDAVDPFGLYGDYVHTVTLDNNLLYLNPQIAAFYPQKKQRIRIFDISNPAKPVEKGEVKARDGQQSLSHDSFIDHRPDGKSLLYGASVHTSDVFDVTKPFESEQLQTIARPDMTISHQLQPNFDRSMLILSDESLIDQNGEVEGWCGKAGPVESGSLHFFKANPDGTFADNGLTKLGSYNEELRKTPRTCTSHVFWPAPDQNRLTEAWYSEGAKVIDFSDPANPKRLGHFVADEPTTYWSVKPHRGYLFATDMERGLDVLRYTGEGGRKWPATAGPAEVQRATFQGVPYKPLPGVSRKGGPLPVVAGASGGAGSTTSAGGQAPSTTPSGVGRAIGRFSFRTKVKGARRGARMTITFLSAKGKRIAAKRFRRGKSSTVRVSGIAQAGTYRYVIKRGKKTVKRGRFTVKPVAGLSLSPKSTLTSKVR